jgi:opacity protein-like surface antigen
MRKFFTIALAACAVSAAAPAAAADWRVVNIDGESERGGVSVAFIDLDSLSRSGDDVRFNMQVRFSTSPAQWDSLRAQVHVECSTRRWESTSSGLYLGENMVQESGRVPMSDTLPETNGFRVVAGVCGNAYMSGTVVPSDHAPTVFAER